MLVFACLLACLLAGKLVSMLGDDQLLEAAVIGRLICFTVVQFSGPDSKTQHGVGDSGSANTLWHNCP